MDSAKLERLINNLGSSHENLVAGGVLSNEPLEDLYGSDSTLEVDLEPGVELSFWADTKRLEAMQITLKDDDGLPVYKGSLPPPYAGATTKFNVRSIFGNPLRSVGPEDLPESIAIKGWDSFQLPSSLHPAALVDFQYNADQQVAQIVFALIDRN